MHHRDTAAIAARAKNPEAQAVEYAADLLETRFRYDGVDWYEWTRGAWRLGITASDVVRSIVHDRYRLAHIASQADEREIAEILASRASTWNRTINAHVGDTQAACHIQMLRDTPKLGHQLNATPSAVVDYRNRNSAPVDSSICDVMAVTRGKYWPRDTKAMRGHLRNCLAYRLLRRQESVVWAIVGPRRSNPAPIVSHARSGIELTQQQSAGHGRNMRRRLSDGPSDELSALVRGVLPAGVRAVLLTMRTTQTERPARSW